MGARLKIAYINHAETLLYSSDLCYSLQTQKLDMPYR